MRLHRYGDSYGHGWLLYVGRVIVIGKHTQRSYLYKRYQGVSRWLELTIYTRRYWPKSYHRLWFNHFIIFDVIIGPGRYETHFGVRTPK